MRFRGRSRTRRGTTVVEAAVVLGVFLLLVLVLLDLGMGVFRYHLAAQAARQGARQASVHGSLATVLGSWGPDPVGPVCGNDSGPLAQTIRAALVGVDPAAVTIWASWPDGGNEPGMRVVVTVRITYQPLLTSLSGTTPLTLQATSTMPISH